MAERSSPPGMMSYQENLPEVYYEPSPPPPNTHDALSLPPLPPKSDYDAYQMQTPATQYSTLRDTRRRGNLCLIIALILAIVVAVIGIVLGAYFGSQYNNIKNSCPIPTQPSQPQSHPGNTNSTASTKTASGTTSAPTGLVTAVVDPQNYTMPIRAGQISQVSWPPYSCPDDIVPGTYNASFNFKIFCNTTLGGQDLAPIVAYSINDCLDSCISYNLNPNKVNGTQCVGWSMALSLAFFTSHPVNANCFLKNTPLPGMSTVSHSQIFGPVWSGVLCKDSACHDIYAGQ